MILLMITNAAKLKQFEKELTRRRRADFFENLKIFEALYQEGVSLKALPSRASLDGLDHCLKLARRLNSV